MLEDSRHINIRFSLEVDEIQKEIDDNCIGFFSLKTTQFFGFAARCKLASPTTIKIILGTSFSTDIFHYGLFLREDALRSARTNESNLDLNIVLPYPPRVSTPIAILRAPSIHTACIPLILDASASMGLAGPTISCMVLRPGLHL